MPHASHTRLQAARPSRPVSAPFPGLVIRANYTTVHYCVEIKVMLYSDVSISRMPNLGIETTSKSSVQSVRWCICWGSASVRDV